MCHLDSPQYEEGAEDESKPGQEERAGSSDEAVQGGGGVGGVAAVPGREGPRLHHTDQQRPADGQTEQPDEGQHHLHPPDLPVNLPVLGGGAEVLSEGHRPVEHEDREGHCVHHGKELHEEGVTLADNPAHPPWLCQEVAGAEADVEDGLHQATQAQLEDDDVVSHPPQGEGGANSGDEDHVGGECDEEYEEKEESGDDLCGEGVGGGGRGPGHGHQGAIVQQEEGDHVLLLVTTDLVTPATQIQQDCPHPLTDGVLLTTNTTL